jgi:hypothetical protein
MSRGLQGGCWEDQDEPSRLQPAEQVAQRLGVGAECGAAAAGQGHRGFRRSSVAGLLAAQVFGFFEFAQVERQGVPSAYGAVVAATVASRPRKACLP